MYAGLGLPDRRKLLEDIRVLLRNRFRSDSPDHIEANVLAGKERRGAKCQHVAVQASDLDVFYADSMATLPVDLPPGW